MSIPIVNLMAGSKAEVEEIGREMLRYGLAGMTFLVYNRFGVSSEVCRGQT